jgi:hypothetical protein
VPCGPLAPSHRASSPGRVVKGSTNVGIASRPRHYGARMPPQGMHREAAVAAVDAVAQNSGAIGTPGVPMSTVVCVYGNAMGYPHGGGHSWVYLNWVLGARALGMDVLWLEDIDASPADRARDNYLVLKRHLAPFGLDECVVLATGRPVLPAWVSELGIQDIHAATHADLLLNLNYDCRRDIVSRFRRTALVDIDPGLVQLWMQAGTLSIGNHDVYFTTGETVGAAGGIPDAGLKWNYTPPPVFLDEWRPDREAMGSAYTTVTHWYHNWETIGSDLFDNSKRASFMDYLTVPLRARIPVEVAVSLGPDEQDDRALLEGHGWCVRDSHVVAGDPWRYREYVRSSRGEFSCAKPSCMRLQNGWISDRTLCYLASGKPAVVQHTGPSRILPDAEGLFRFRDPDEAVRHLQAAEDDYERHCRAARALAESHFDATKVVGSVLERALS